MAVIEYLRVDDVSAGLFLDSSERSAMLLSYPTENGWRARRDKSNDAFVSRCLADIRNKITQEDNETGCVFSCVSQLAESVKGSANIGCEGSVQRRWICSSFSRFRRSWCRFRFWWFQCRFQPRCYEPCCLFYVWWRCSTFP